MQTASPRTVLLVDCDVFYVQLARMADPEGAGRARLLIVGGSAESRGVVCSASYEVRAFGVRSGMPIARAVKLCPQATCVPVPRTLCSAKSREILRVLERFAPAVESASPDEAYADLSSAMDTIYRGRTVEEIAQRIREAVLLETDIRVSVGAGTNRLVAKLAVERAKPRPGTTATGVHVVPPGEEARFVATFALADIPGIGPKFQERLNALGWHSVRDILSHDTDALARHLSEREASWLYHTARGIDPSTVTPRMDAKSVGKETTFARDLSDDEAIRQALLALTDMAVSHLRDDGYAARTVTVKLKDHDFKLRHASRTLLEPLTTYQAIAPVAVELLRRLRSRRRTPARLVGVSLSSLASADGAQLSLLQEPGVRETSRQRTVAKAVDQLRARYGRAAVSFGTTALGDRAEDEP